MLVSLAWIWAVGLVFAYLAERLRLPRLVGMLLAGILLGPWGVNLLHADLLGISSDLRQLALVIILLRAGLALQVQDLKRIGRPALLMSFVPASAEILGVFLLAPLLLPLTSIEATVLGTVLAAVSPAVIVPNMLRLMEAGYGRRNRIPQLLLAGASVDDIFVIVLFTACTGLALGGQLSVWTFVGIPVSILLGAGLGWLMGQVFRGFLSRFSLPVDRQVLWLLSAALALVGIEKALAPWVPVSGLIAVMGMAMVFQNRAPQLAKPIASSCSALWTGAEVLLFGLVGASVNLGAAWSRGVGALLLIVGALVFRMLGVGLCLLRTKLVAKERLFCMLAYTPKATVQAAIGGLPLAMGLPCGDTVLAVAVLSILLTAPLGAFGIQCTHPLLLSQD